MDANEVNKVAGAVLGILTLAMGIGFFSGALVSPKPVLKAGYELPDNTAAATAAAPAAAEAAEPIAKRMASADVAKGESAAKKCASCHQFTKDGKNGTGPLLYGVLNRAKGAAPAFKYSAGLAGKGGTWDYAALDEFLTNPKGYISGTSMGFAGIARADERANIIAYLRSMADAPAPLPQ
jgi:cytochrome c